MPIDLSVIKKAKRTLKNKFLVAGFDGDDFEGHEPDSTEDLQVGQRVRVLGHESIILKVEKV